MAANGGYYLKLKVGSLATPNGRGKGKGEPFGVVPGGKPAHPLRGSPAPT